MKAQLKYSSKNYKVFDENLLNEMLTFGDNKSHEMKVNRVYYKCLRAGHIETANKIKSKYSSYFMKLDDTVTSLYLALSIKLSPIT